MRHFAKHARALKANNAASRAMGTRSLALVAVIGLLSACGGGVTPTAGNLGTRICVINNSSQSPAVQFSKKDTATFEGVVSSGGEACAEGTFFIGNDVEGSIVMSQPVASMTFTGTNPWAGLPGTVVYQSGGRFCTGGASMEIGSYFYWDDAVVRYTVKRLPDDQWKEFTITIEDSDSPASDGRSKECPDSGGDGPF
jgi:hypothetical protein